MTPLRWLVVGTFVNRVGGGVRFLLVLYLVTQRDFEPAAAGAVAMGWGAGSLLSQPVAGALADARGRRTVIVATMGGSAVLLAALGAARAPWLIALLAVGAGVLNEGFRPAVQAMVADLAAPEDRARAFGLVYWATNAGFTVAMALSGLLASVSWTLVFAVDAAGCAAFAVLARLRLPETRPEPDPHAAPGGYAVALRDPRLVLVTGLQLCFGYMLLQSAATLPLAMAADGHGAAAYGAVMAVAGFVVVVLQPGASARLGHLPHGLVYAAGLLLVAAGFASTLLAGSLAGFVACVVVWAAGEVAVASVAGAIVADLAPIHLRGRYMGVFSMAMPVAAILAPGLGTLVFEAAGETVHWLSVGAVGVFAALLAPSLSRGSPRPA